MTQLPPSRRRFKFIPSRKEISYARRNFRVVAWYRFNTELSVLQEKQAVNNTMIIVASRGTYRTFRCWTKNQIHEASAADNTWFERRYFPPEACLVITYAFALKYSYEQAIRESSIVAGKFQPLLNMWKVRLWLSIGN